MTDDTRLSELQRPHSYRMASLSDLDDGSFVPPPLTRTNRTQSWFQRLPTLHRPNTSRPPSALTSSSSESLNLLRKAVKKFYFTLTGKVQCDPEPLREWQWYCTYLEYRAASAWTLCAAVLVDVTSQTSSDDLGAQSTLYTAFTIVAECLYHDFDVDFASVVEKLRASGSIHGHASNDDLISFTFQVMGWLSAMWDPLPAPETPHLLLRAPQIESRRWERMTRRSPKLTILEASRQTVQRVANRLDRSMPVPAISPDDYYRVDRDIESASITTAYLSYHSLVDLVKVNIVWTDTLFEHLKFDSRTKSLYVFRHPSICLLLIRADGDTILSRMFEAECKEKLASEHGYCPTLVGFEDFLLEVLSSYQLIFGYHRDSRRRIAPALSSTAFEQGTKVDPLLKMLCTSTPKSPEVIQLYKELELQQYENEISISDVPFLARKLLCLESVSKRHTPNTLRRLWRDRRSPMTWFALWAVLIIGLGSLILAFGSFVAQAAQLGFQIHPAPPR